MSGGDGETTESGNRQITLDDLTSQTEAAQTYNDQTDGSDDDLPQYLPEEDIPDPPTDPRKAAPDNCSACGGQYPWGKPLERGPEQPSTCPPDELEECDCCVCPECGARSIYYRKTKSPDFRCRNPDCDDREFDEPAHPATETQRELIYYECRYCGDPTLGPVGITPPD